MPVDIDDPNEHLLAVHERLAATRGEKAFQVLDQLAGMMNVLPTSTLVSAARHQAETVDFTTSNLRGAPFPLFFGGRADRGELPGGAAGRDGVQPDDAQLRGGAAPGAAGRHRGHPGPGGAA